MTIEHEPKNGPCADEDAYFMFHAEGVDFYWGSLTTSSCPGRKNVVCVPPSGRLRTVLTYGGDRGALWNPFILDQVPLAPETKQLITAYIKLLR